MDRLEHYLTQQEAPTSEDSPLLRRQIAYERIKDAIQHGDLEPGSPLSETKLSRLLGISRTPVREALQQLSQEGLVEIIPGQAVTVASRSLNDVLNTVHIRSLLEPELARLVAQAATHEQVAILGDAVQKMEEAIQGGDALAWARANTIYHETMSDACPNQLLGATVLTMWNRVHHLANIDSQTNPKRLAECTMEHRRIVDAIAAKDPKEAEEAMRDHIHELRTSLFNRLSFGAL